jgi:iron complex transport system substrate-binding protein
MLVRIVSLLSSATEILFAIGIGEQVVAISHECDYPAAATSLPRATRSRIDSSRPSSAIDMQVKQLLEAGEPLYEIDRGLIRELAPDLIVTQAQCDVCAVRYQDVVDFVAGERALAWTKVLALNPQSLADVLVDLERVGAAAGAAAAAREYVRTLDRRIRRIDAKWHGTSKGQGVDCESRLCDVEQSSPQSTLDPVRASVVCLEWLGPLMAAGNWTPELIELAGGESRLAESGHHSGYVDWVTVRDCDPDVLLIAPCGFDLARSMAEARRLWELPGFCDLKSIRSGRAYVIDGNAYLNRSGPRIVDSLEILAHLIRPDRFPASECELAEGRAWSRLCK